MAVTTLSVAVNATFFISGMLGLQLQLPTDGEGQPKLIQTSFTTAENISNSSAIINSVNSESTQISNEYGNNGSRKSRSFQCGSILCSENEVCVTWKLNEKQQGVVVKECHPNDGVHYTKTNPKNSSNILCKSGFTYSILDEPQPCLQETPSCDLVWKYNCVKENDSPHSCSLKRCPYNFVCLELVHCGLSPPCLEKIECHSPSRIETNH